MRLDHISYACTSNEIADVVQRIGSDLGASFVDGGRHPSFGTRNFVLPLAEGCYIEVVSALDHPAAEKAPFGRAVQQRAADGGGWLGWVISVSDMPAVEARLGRSASPGRRIRPDGQELTWHQIGVLDLMDDPQLPFFVAWDCPTDMHPSRPGGACRIERIEICGDESTVREWLGGSLQSLPGDIEISWIPPSADEDTGIVAVWFATPHGSVRID